MKELFFYPSNDVPAFLLRIVLAIIMFPHGAQKVLGWFGGNGFNATMQFFTGTMKLPWVIALLVIIIEFVGPVALIAGFASRLWAFGIMIIMIGAIAITHHKNGFFMNWFGKQAGEGYEYHLLVIAICIALMINGSGRYSVDNVIASKIFY